MNLPTGKRYGFIAQDVEEVLPHLVKATIFETSRTVSAAKEPEVSPQKSSAKQVSETIAFKAINYIEIVPILVKAMQEQQLQIEELKNQVRKLSGGQNMNTITGLGTLGQNIPNPVGSSTRIPYQISLSAKKAQLLFTDNLGKTIKQIPVNGSGEVNLNTATFSSGIYNYSLIVDGVIVESKRLEVLRNK
jgi:hypothetical protein